MHILAPPAHGERHCRESEGRETGTRTGPSLDH